MRVELFDTGDFGNEVATWISVCVLLELIAIYPLFNTRSDFETRNDIIDDLYPHISHAIELGGLMRHKIYTRACKNIAMNGVGS